MENTNLKALLNNLRHATEFLNAANADAASAFNGTGLTAIEWVQTAALELGNALIAQPDLDIEKLRDEVARLNQYNISLNQENEQLFANYQAVDDEALRLRQKLAAAQASQVQEGCNPKWAIGTLREAVEYLDANSLNQISSGSVLHRCMRGALEAAVPVAQSEVVGEGHE